MVVQSAFITQKLSEGYQQQGSNVLVQYTPTNVNRMVYVKNGDTSGDLYYSGTTEKITPEDRAILENQGVARGAIRNSSGQLVTTEAPTTGEYPYQVMQNKIYLNDQGLPETTEQYQTYINKQGNPTPRLVKSQTFSEQTGNPISVETINRGGGGAGREVGSSKTSFDPITGEEVSSYSKISKPGGSVVFAPSGGAFGSGTMAYDNSQSYQEKLAQQEHLSNIQDLVFSEPKGTFETSSGRTMTATEILDASNMSPSGQITSYGRVIFSTPQTFSPDYGSNSTQSNQVFSKVMKQAQISNGRTELISSTLEGSYTPIPGTEMNFTPMPTTTSFIESITGKASNKSTTPSTPSEILAMGFQPKTYSTEKNYSSMEEASGFQIGKGQPKEYKYTEGRSIISIGGEIFPVPFSQQAKEISYGMYDVIGSMPTGEAHPFIQSFFATGKREELEAKKTQISSQKLFEAQLMESKAEEQKAKAKVNYGQAILVKQYEGGFISYDDAITGSNLLVSDATSGFNTNVQSEKFNAKVNKTYETNMATALVGIGYAEKSKAYRSPNIYAQQEFTTPLFTKIGISTEQLIAKNNMAWSNEMISATTGATYSEEQLRTGYKTPYQKYGQMVSNIPIGIVSEIEYKPVSTAGTFVLGAGVGAVGEGLEIASISKTAYIASTAKAGSNIFKVAGYVGGGVYAGVTGYEIAVAPVAEKGLIIGKTAVDVGAFTLGAITGQKAVKGSVSLIGKVGGGLEKYALSKPQKGVKFELTGIKEVGGIEVIGGKKIATTSFILETIPREITTKNPPKLVSEIRTAGTEKISQLPNDFTLQNIEKDMIGKLQFERGENGKITNVIFEPEKVVRTEFKEPVISIGEPMKLEKFTPTKLTEFKLITEVQPYTKEPSLKQFSFAFDKEMLRFTKAEKVKPIETRLDPLQYAKHLDSRGKLSFREVDFDIGGDPRVFGELDKSAGFRGEDIMVIRKSLPSKKIVKNINTASENWKDIVVSHELIHHKTPDFIFKIQDTTGISRILPYKTIPTEQIAFGLQEKYVKIGFKTKLKLERPSIAEFNPKEPQPSKVTGHIRDLGTYKVTTTEYPKIQIMEVPKGTKEGLIAQKYGVFKVIPKEPKNIPTPRINIQNKEPKVIDLDKMARAYKSEPSLVIPYERKGTFGQPKLEYLELPRQEGKPISIQRLEAMQEVKPTTRGQKPSRPVVEYQRYQSKTELVGVMLKGAKYPTNDIEFIPVGKLKTGIKTGSRYEFNQKIVPNVMPKFNQNLMISPMQKQQPSQKLIPVEILKPVTKQDINMQLIPRLKTQPGLRQIQTYPNPKMPEFYIPRTPPGIPFLPPIGGGGFGFGKSPSYKMSSKQAFGYTPSLRAGLFNIHGKAPKLFGGKFYTGEELRPILSLPSRKKKRRK